MGDLLRFMKPNQNICQDTVVGIATGYGLDSPGIEMQ